MSTRNQLTVGKDREGQLKTLLAYIAGLSATKAFIVTVEDFARNRSDQQNRYLFGVAYRRFADATGNDVDDIHEYFLGERFGWIEVEIAGHIKRKPAHRSSKLTTVQFEELCEFIRAKAAEYGVWIPEPNEPAPKKPTNFTKD